LNYTHKVLHNQSQPAYNNVPSTTNTTHDHHSANISFVALW